MIAGSVARRYARALLQIGTADGNLERIGREVGDLAAALKRSAELAQALSSPVFQRADREKVLRALLDRIGATQAVVNLTRLLLDRERIAVLPDISRELDVMIDARAGRVAARVRSAVPLDEQQQKRLVKTLESLSGKKVEMAVEHDPALLGGLVAQVGDVVYDGSLRTQLEKIRNELVG
ncbi:MAG TPA: ATP synthase F1 subunit delta [Candidatus Acidoferrum sp.]|nr:ATP synthase F1 subunit delta [Candidatus Acidoferrum sp.]